MFKNLPLKDKLAYLGSYSSASSETSDAEISTSLTLRPIAEAGESNHARGNSSGASGQGQGSKTRLLFIVGDPGLEEHNGGELFNLAAATKKTELEARGNFDITIVRASSFEDFKSAFQSNGMLDGIEYFGHGGPHYLYVGEKHEAGTNVDMNNVGQLPNTHLNKGAYIQLNGCSTGNGDYNIASSMSFVLDRPVYAYTRGTEFQTPQARRGSVGPVYMVGGPGSTFKKYLPR